MQDSFQQQKEGQKTKEMEKAAAAEHKESGSGGGGGIMKLPQPVPVPLHQQVEGKVAMVTGASSGLGRQMALCLARHGCHIVAAARRLSMLKDLCDHVNNGNNNARAMAIELDVSASADAVDKAIDHAWNCFGRIDVLVNNAGVRGNVAIALEIPEEEWDKVIKTNLKGSWVVSRAVGKRMRDAKMGGSIINISSIAGLQRAELPGGTAYAASKAGVNAMTKLMALELGQYNIRVNSVAPGLFESEITAGLIQKEWLATVGKKIVPLQHWGRVDPSLTSLILLLSSDSSAYVTGNVFIVDGGQTLPGVPLYSSL